MLKRSRTWGNGRPFSYFHDLAEIDLKESHDGRSPDAPCIAVCYAGSLSMLNKYEGFLFCSDWKQALVGDSFDGASVMLGSQNGTAKLLTDMTVHRRLGQEAFQPGDGGKRARCFAA